MLQKIGNITVRLPTADKKDSFARANMDLNYISNFIQSFFISKFIHFYSKFKAYSFFQNSELIYFSRLNVPAEKPLADIA